jgi:hypothetical protein
MSVQKAAKRGRLSRSDVEDILRWFYRRRAANQGKQARVLACVLAGVETAADIEVELGFELTRHQIAGHLSNLLKAGKIRKAGEFVVPGRPTAYRYGPPGQEQM